MLGHQLSENFKKGSKELYKVYDRFSFDKIFRLLLKNGYEHEEALDFILCDCALSALVFQERIYNKYYLNLSHEDIISDDLFALICQALHELGVNNYFHILSMALGVSKNINKFNDNSLIQYIEDSYNTIGSKNNSEDRNKKLNGKITRVNNTIYAQLQNTLGVEIKPAPDEWDRLYNVDFYIEVRGKYIGIQIKPITFKHTFEDYKWKEMQETTHRKFEEKFGGKVFTVFSVKEGQKKVIYNPEVIDDIKKEIEKLQKENP